MSPHFSAEQRNPSRKRRTYKHVKAEPSYRRVFDSAMIGLAIVELDGKVRAVNNALCEMFGYSSDELVGRPFPVATRPEDSPAAKIHLQLLAQEIDGFRTEIQYVRKDGAIVHALSTASLERNSAGRPTHFLSQVVDITSLRRAEEALRESEQRFRLAFESAAIGFAVAATDGRFTAVNHSFCEMVGYTEAELLNMRYADITHAEDLALIEPTLERLRATGTALQEKRFIRKDGLRIWTSVGLGLARDATGQPAYVLAQITDITARKEAEESATHHAVELEQSNSDLRQFAYLASHDLQQPLRAVASYSRLLSDRYGQALDARAARWISYITEGVDRMQRLIDDLFTLAGVGTDVKGFKPLSVGATVEHCWDALLVANANVNASLTTAALPVIEGDAPQIELLFQNLLGNAIKYRRRDALLEVSISAERYASPLGTIWEFAVRDNGIGFDMAYREQIFEIFRRLHSGAEYEGTGIGLALCRKIVERHGGRIWADSTVGKGSTFTFSLNEHRPS
jgi:PAS domain S-box-containing protein